MLINEILYPIEDIWEGHLVPAFNIYATPGEALPKASIGKPLWWTDKEILGDNWNPPRGKNRYVLARFAFSLRPEGREEVSKAELVVDFYAGDGGRRPVAFDLLPRAETEYRTRTFNIGIGPEFKFGLLDVNLAKAETAINLSRAFPVIIADGIGENTARWIFESQPTRPLIGSQVVYAIIETAPKVSAINVCLFLTAEIATKIGPIKGLLPREEQCNLDWELR
jgi:hypothetical protein